MRVVLLGEQFDWSLNSVMHRNSYFTDFFGKVVLKQCHGSIVQYSDLLHYVWSMAHNGLSNCSRIVKIIHFACSSQCTACELAGKLINQIVRQVRKNGRNSFIVSVDASHWCNVHVSRAEILWNRILKMMHKLGF